MKLFDDNKAKIIFQSQVKLRITYELENEAVDLNKQPNALIWAIKVKEDQQEMLDKLKRKCMRHFIALPDQKSLINYLMVVLDGERVAARIKQFMCMI